MGIDVYWKNERGDVLGELSDAKFLLSDLSELFYQQPGSCVRYIDPAGDACFNQLQLPDLLAELHVVRSNITGAPSASQLDDLIALVSQAHGSAHSYVWFVGD